jgi:DNA helicase-2/ATP-dependent DNA helicase PcrA
MRESFKTSRFGDKVPLFAERPFLLYVDGFVVGGRIDAIFGEPDGPWEIVDYKTGRVPSADDPLRRLQLDLYALAGVEVWGKRPEDLTLTYFYLSAEDPDAAFDSHSAGDPAETRQRVAEALRGIAAGEFAAQPGHYCNWCDFLAFCPPGRAYLESRELSEATERRD